MARPDLPEGSFYVRHSEDFIMRRDFRRASGRELPDSIRAFHNLLVLDVSSDREAVMFVTGFLSGSAQAQSEMDRAS